MSEEPGPRDDARDRPRSPPSNFGVDERRRRGAGRPRALRRDATFGSGGGRGEPVVTAKKALRTDVGRRVTRRARTRRLAVLLVLVVALVASPVVPPATPAAAVTGQTSLHFNSEVGDSIGGGQTRTWTPSDGTFATTNEPAAVTVRFQGATNDWNLTFIAPIGATLIPGPYDRVAKDPTPTRGGIFIYGSGSGCSRVTGRFTPRAHACARRSGRAVRRGLRAALRRRDRHPARQRPLPVVVDVPPAARPRPRRRSGQR